MKVIVALAIVLATTALLPAAQQKPIKEEWMILDGMLPSTSVDEMTARATAVIVATYTGKSQLKERQFSGSIARSTAYTFQIQDIPKLHQYLPFVGNEIVLEMPGGDKEFPTYILREKDRDMIDSFKRERTYLIFLGWNEYLEQFVPQYGSGALFDVTDGELIAIHHKGRNFDHTPAAGFVAAVRAAAR